jgi:hypothetical protein
MRRNWVLGTHKLLGTEPAVGWTSNPNEVFLAPLEWSPELDTKLAAGVRKLRLHLPPLDSIDLGLPGGPSQELASDR